MISKIRSMVKGIIWRLMGIGFLAGVTYLFTGDWITAGLITVLHHLTFIFVYYFHERVWHRVKKGRLFRFRKWIRPFTYEIVLGNLILGSISLALTGSWTKTTLITFTYIGNKLWMYVVYDKIWDRIKWGKRE